MMIKMVAFDVFGVVITEGHMVSSSLMPLLPKHTSKSLVKSFYNPYTRGEISEQSFWQGIGLSDYTEIRQTFLHSFVLDADLKHVVHQLSDKYALSILSNLGSAWADTLSEKFAFKQSFAPIIFSGKVGFEKPNPEIYALLIAESGLEAHEIIFIDDRLENLAVAHQLGMKTVHYQRESDTFDYQADYQIQKLSALLDILNGLV